MNMTDCIKLMEPDDATYGGTQWGDGVTNTERGGGTGMCGPGWLHAYRDAYEAAFFSPIHVKGYTRARRATADVAEEHRDKLLCTRVTTHEVVDLPTVTTEQRAEIALRCVLLDKRRYKGRAMVRRWADAWLDGTDRTAESADAARDVAYAAGCDAYDEGYTAYAAGGAAKAAGDAANAASYSAKAAWWAANAEGYTAYAAAYASDAAGGTAYAAGDAANAASYATHAASYATHAAGCAADAARYAAYATRYAANPLPVIHAVCGVTV